MISSAEEANKIIEKWKKSIVKPSKFEKDLIEEAEAKGYLSALEGPQVKELVETSKRAFEAIRLMNSHIHKQCICQLGKHCIWENYVYVAFEEEKVLSKFREAVKK